MQEAIYQFVLAAGPAGLTPEALTSAIGVASRSTVNRYLAALCASGAIKALGAGRSTRYIATTAFSRADIDAYFERPANSRPVAPFREAMLLPSPNIDPGRALRCTRVQALANAMDRKYLAEFIIDFSWGSSVLEGSSYSALDTAALIQYGQQNKSKPTADALLALNHKRAGEHLWAHRELSVENLRAMHALLTDDHGLPEVAGSDHFLPPEQRGKPRDFEEVSLMNSAYIPPFRPGTGHAAALLDEIMSTASELAPVEAALYLMTRIAYAQSFANGNKRTSRIAANLPLLAASLIPFSFVDVDKADYIRGMAAFYELGSIHAIEQTFIRGYAKSIVRSSNIPPAMRSRGFDPDQIADLLVTFINTGKPLTDARARAFFKM